MLLKMAFRNVFRNKKRSFLSMLTVIVGVMGMISAYGLARGVEDTIIRVDVDTDFGHLRVMHKAYNKDKANFPLELQVQKPKQVIQAIKKKFPNAVAFERILFAVDLGDGLHSVRCRGIALPAKAAEKAYSFKQYTQKKRLLVDGENSIYLGAELAKLFEKKVGEAVTLLVRTSSGSLNALDFTIRDIIRTGNLLVDSNTLYMSLKTGRDLLQMPKGSTDVIVRLPKETQSVAAAAAVSGISSDNFARTWQHKMQEIIELQKIDRQFYNFLIALIMFVAAIGIANTMLMSGYERHGEIGMMMAQGMRSAAIMKMFAIEAFFLGLFGSLIGGAIGSSIALYFQAYGMPLPGGNEIAEGASMTISTTIYFSVSAQLIIMSFVIGVVISVLGSLWPAWRFTRMKPLEVMTGSEAP